METKHLLRISAGRTVEYCLYVGAEIVVHCD